jgi:pyridoxine kinase
VLTGYLPSLAHVDIAQAACERVRAANAGARLVCDPVLGDTPGGLYIDEAAAADIGQSLMPLCDLATPNAFELAWLARRPVDTVDDAVAAARTLGVAAVLATSIPATGDRLATLLVGETEAQACFVPRRPTAPHGTGDLLTALYLGHVLNGVAPDASLARAVAAVEASIAASTGRDELSLGAAGAIWTQAAGLPTVTL